LPHDTPARPTDRVGAYWLGTNRDGYYTVCWYDAAAKQRRAVSTRTRDIDEARRALAEKALADPANPLTSLGEVTLLEILKRYELQHGINLPSAGGTRRSIELWIAFFGETRRLADTSTTDIERFARVLLAEGFKRSYVSRVLSVGRAAMRRAHRQEPRLVVPFVPEIMTAEHREAVEPKGRPLELAELARVFDDLSAVPRRRHLLRLLYVLVGTMCRPNAAFDMTVGMLDWRHGLVNLLPAGQVQTRKRRPTVPLSSVLSWHLSDLRDCPPATPVVSWGGDHIGTVDPTWRRMRERLGLDERVQPYSIRHTMARQLRARGVPHDQIELMLGHRKPTGSSVTTMIYAPFEPGYCRVAVAAIDDVFREISALCERPIVPPSVGVEG
jgi:integrase